MSSGNAGTENRTEHPEAFIVFFSGSCLREQGELYHLSENPGTSWEGPQEDCAMCSDESSPNAGIYQVHPRFQHCDMELSAAKFTSRTGRLTYKNIANGISHTVLECV